MAYTPECVIAQARAEIGYTESPANSNMTKFAAEAGHANGEPWCATFVCALARRCGGTLGDESAYTPSLYESMDHTSDPQPGDLAFFDFPDSLHRIQHVGLVVAVTPDTVTCIEGNTSAGNSGSQSNGGGVFERTRSRNVAVGFGRPNYSQGADMTPGESEALVEVRDNVRTLVGLVNQLVAAINENLTETRDNVRKLVERG